LAQTTEQGGLALRYAGALLELAEEKHALDAVSADLVALGHMIADSSDLRKLITSPLMDRADQARAIGAVNTLRRTTGGWEGTNTDVAGFLEPLERCMALSNTPIAHHRARYPPRRSRRARIGCISF